MNRPTDPMERLIFDALVAADVAFDMEPKPACLDFHLPQHDIYIEVKQFHSPRIAEQLARAPNVIVAQGRPAVEALASWIRAGTPTS